MSAAKVIPLVDVRNALMCAMVRRSVAGGAANVGRFAAYSQYPLLNIDCGDRLRRLRPFSIQRMHFGPMYAGYLDRTLDKVRLYRGLPEVRRTWGAGLRALRAEFNSGVMR